MKFDLVTLCPMHRRCITLISSLLTPSGWVRKPLNYLKVRTGMYRYILLRTNMEFLYCPVPSRTGTYWYVPVRTILPNPVQGYRIPDDGNGLLCGWWVRIWTGAGRQPALADECLDLFQNINLIRGQQPPASDSLIWRKSRKVQLDTRFYRTTFLLCLDETRPMCCR